MKQNTIYYKVVKPLFIKLRLERIIDLFAFFKQYLANYSSNKAFKREHPEFILPPDYMLYEAYQLNYKQYYNDAHENWVAQVVEGLFSWEDGSKILEWGCGPARLIRNLPNEFPNCEFYGTDYNSKTINWCTNNLKDITFKENQLAPPIDFESNYFDLIYNVSVFTHLSEDLHIEWLKELHRLLKPGGLLVLTFHGQVFTKILDPLNTEKYNQGDFVEISSYKNGHRSYASFQPKSFMKKILTKNGFSIIKHNLGTDNGTWLEQDTLICTKN